MRFIYLLILTIPKLCTPKVSETALQIPQLEYKNFEQSIDLDLNQFTSKIECDIFDVRSFQPDQFDELSVSTRDALLKIDIISEWSESDKERTLQTKDSGLVTVSWDRDKYMNSFIANHDMKITFVDNERIGHSLLVLVSDKTGLDGYLKSYLILLDEKNMATAAAAVSFYLAMDDTSIFSTSRVTKEGCLALTSSSHEESAEFCVSTQRKFLVN